MAGLGFAMAESIFASTMVKTGKNWQ